MGAARSGIVGAIASLALHAAAVIWLPRAADVSVAGEIATAPHRPTSPRLPAGTSAMTLVDLLVTLPDGSRQSILAPDSDGRRDGGERTAPNSTWLLDRADRLTLQDSMRNAVRESQVQRIDTASDRASYENRRATLHPDDDPFLATGQGWLRQRARPSAIAPQSGQAGPLLPAHASMDRAAHSPQVPADRALVNSHGAPDRSVIALRGRRDSRGESAQRAAPVRTGRPDVDPGPPATPSATFDRVRDNRASELRAAELMQAFVHAGAASREPGSGLGGSGEGAVAGVGQTQRSGGTSAAHGGGGDADPGGEPYIRWYAEQRDRVSRALVFPRERQLSMDQGTTLLRLSVGRDGGLLDTPRIIRSSGFGDLDAAAIAAVQRSAPFSPLPDEIAPNSARVRLLFPIEFWNPTVH